MYYSITHGDQPLKNIPEHLHVEGEVYKDISSSRKQAQKLFAGQDTYKEWLQTVQSQKFKETVCKVNKFYEKVDLVFLQHRVRPVLQSKVQQQMQAQYSMMKHKII